MKKSTKGLARIARCNPSLATKDLRKHKMGFSASVFASLIAPTAVGLLTLLHSPVAMAAPTYGYAGVYQLLAGPNTVNTYPGTDQFSTYSQGASFNQANNVAWPGSPGNPAASASLSGSLVSDGQNVGLHETTQTLNGGYANQDIIYYDTIHVSGPSGQTAQFQVNLSLSGVINSMLMQADGSPADVQAYLNLYSTANGTLTLASQPIAGGVFDAQVLDFMKAGTFTGTASALYTIASGTTITLAIDMGVRNAFASGTSTVDFGDTGYMTVSGLTPGFTLTADSGLTYAQAPSPVPLPASIWLLCSALGGMGLIARKHAGQAPS